jgi:rod shape-determining protein MreC
MLRKLLEIIRNNGDRFFFSFLVIISLIIVIFSSDNSRLAMQNVGSSVSGVFERGFSAVGNGITSGFRSLKSNKTLLEENTKLKQELLELKQKTALYNTVLEENQELRHLLNFSRRIEYKNIPARIISGSPEPEDTSFKLNIGKSSGIKPGMAVVSYNEEGIVLLGKIRNVNIVTSTFLPVYDKNFITGAEIQSCRRKGKIEGAGTYNSFMVLKNVSSENSGIKSDFDKDDLIVTSSDSTLFPAGIPIGFIDEINKNTWDLSSSIKIRPYTDLHKIHFVYVLAGE